ncbi:MAG: BMP family ABC transporter substrate-binding protein [Dermatophilaceae bacterium]
MRLELRAVALVAVAALGMGACSSSPTGTTTNPTQTSLVPTVGGRSPKVGLAFDAGGRAPGTANELASRGLEKAAKELGVDAKEVNPQAQGADRAQLLRQLVSEGYNPVIGVGAGYADPMETLAKEYPHVQFVRIDGEPSAYSNVAVMSFAEQQGAFLMGVAAALKSKTNHVGFIGTNQSIASSRSAAGFAQGARQITPNIVVDDVRLDTGVGTKGLNDPAGAKAAAQGMYRSGADIVFTSAGESYAGSFPAALEAGKLAIGAGADQYLTVADPAWRPVILTSMVKRVDTAVYQSIFAFKSDGKVDKRTFGLHDEGLGYATSGGAIDATTKSKLDDYSARIGSGDLVVGQA